tara:strand:+ start:3031 stop:4704 length:1674 start_codon:yes stop_codon:yes gene_type:complete
MADQVKQLAFKKFTVDELRNGTAVNVLTTDANTHYVIKSIESEQAVTTSSVNVDATIGLTSGISGGEFVNIGRVAQANRRGLQGSLIMDASSTLTLRPVAQTLNFTDVEFQLSMENQGSSGMRKHRKHTMPFFDSFNRETTLETNSEVDKTGTTFGGNSYGMSSYNDNYAHVHTKPNGERVLIHFINSSSGGSDGFELWNYDTGAHLGYKINSYAKTFYDGVRYIFWAQESTYHIRYFDLNETFTNMQPANTMGGSSGANYYHGIVNMANGATPNFVNRTTYDNRTSSFYFDHELNKRFFVVGSKSNGSTGLVELPSTLTNGQTVTATKWVYITNSTSANNFTDPFGNNGNSAKSYGNVLNGYTGSVQAKVDLTYDFELERYFIWYNVGNNFLAPFTFTRADYDGTSNGSTLYNSGSTNSSGLTAVAFSSASLIGMETGDTIFKNWDNGNGAINLNNLTTYSDNFTYNANRVYFMRGRKMYMRSASSPFQLHEIDFSKSTSVNTLINTGLSDSDAGTSYNQSFSMAERASTNSEINSRAYTTAPNVKIRVTGILSDQ